MAHLYHIVGIIEVDATHGDNNVWGIARGHRRAKNGVDCAGVFRKLSFPRFFSRFGGSHAHIIHVSSDGREEEEEAEG